MSVRKTRRIMAWLMLGFIAVVMTSCVAAFSFNNNCGAETCARASR